MPEPIADQNVFIVYGFDRSGLEDPQAIVQRGIEDNAVLKAPVVAEDPAAALDFFSAKFPHVLVAGISSLADLKDEVTLLEAFVKATGTATAE